MAPKKTIRRSLISAFAAALFFAGYGPMMESATDQAFADSPADSGHPAAVSTSANLAALYDYDPPDVKLSKAYTDIVIMAPQQYVWDKLTNFGVYPKLFPRLKTCQVVKKEGDLVYIESLLKPQMFVNQPCQHTINDLEDKPDSLKWKLTDGNFKAVAGEWRLKSIDDGQHTQVRYTMEVDPGPLIPRPVIVLALKMVQKEAVINVKNMVEQEYATSQTALNGKKGSISSKNSTGSGQADPHS